MNHTKIEYLDYTLNLAVGCNGFDCGVREYCFAKRMGHRFGLKRWGCALCQDFIPHYHVIRFDEPRNLSKPSRIGLNFMADTFDRGLLETVPNGWNMTVEMIEEAHWHTYLVLTKQPQNIPIKDYPDNLWLGVSVNRKSDLWRLDKLRDIDLPHRFGSFEPLYEDLGEVNLEGFEWVIIGAQTRPMLLPKKEWVKSLIEQAMAKQIPIFMKNNLAPLYIDDSFIPFSSFHIKAPQNFPKALRKREN